MYYLENNFRYLLILDLKIFKLVKEYISYEFSRKNVFKNNSNINCQLIWQQYDLY